MNLYVDDDMEKYFSTHDVTFPSDDDLGEAMWKYEEWKQSENEL